MTVNKRPLILVTNDDGILAPGIRALIEVAHEIGEVVVVAPDKAQSGQGHAITMREPLRVQKVHPFSDLGDVESYQCTGTPVDCVKVAKHAILKGRKIDLCVSGVNHGANTSINILYSGTMSAAMEASIAGIPAIGFSLLDFSYDANFEPSKPHIKTLIEYALAGGMKGTKLLNVNIPKLPAEEIKGIKICRQAEGIWIENFKEGKDPSGEPYYWLAGVFYNQDKGEDNDLLALKNGYVSAVPCGHDLTAHSAIELMKGDFL